MDPLSTPLALNLALMRSTAKPCVIRAKLLRSKERSWDRHIAIFCGCGLSCELILAKYAFFSDGLPPHFSVSFHGPRDPVVEMLIVCRLAPAKASADAFDASPMLAGSAFDVVESCHLLTKGNLALTPRCTIRGGYLRSRQAFMHLEFQLSWLISIANCAK